MFKSGLRSAVAALAMIIGAAGAAHAGLVNWTITDGKFADGGTLSGTFSFDSVTGDIVNYDLVTTPGADGTFPGLGSLPGPTQFGTEYSLFSGDMWFYGTGQGYPAFSQAVYFDPNGNYFITSELDLTSIPVPSSGAYNLAGSTEGLFGDAEIPLQGASRTLVSGTAVGVGAVPEPATWAMLIVGVAMVGFTLRRQRQGAALAA